ncbi:hypothetical protein HMPREF3113_16685 [Stenotrophomonas sp. HMSC10F06]|nr:hypothetical protein HMPREF3113_16685 [Stenotrophomonas sp. HMSC10F06]
MDAVQRRVMETYRVIDIWRQRQAGPCNDPVAASQLRRDYNQWHTSQGAVHAMLVPMEWREYV